MLTHMFYAPKTKTCVPDDRNNFRFHVAFLLQSGYCRKSLYPLQAGNDPEGTPEVMTDLLYLITNKVGSVQLIILQVLIH